MPSRATKLKKLQNRSRQPGHFSDFATSDDQPATTTYLSIIDGVRTTEDIPLLPEVPLLAPSNVFSAEDNTAISEFVGLDEDQIMTDTNIESHDSVPAVEKDETGPKTQTRAYLEAFQEILPRLHNLLFELEVDSHTGEACKCGSGETCEVRCEECFEYPVKCRQCFIADHLRMPFHWAWLWDQGHFQKRDIHTLGHIIQFGHGGEPCSMPSSLIKMNIVCTNGEHDTTVKFCGCRGPIDRVDQLIRARLFPSTAKLPRQAFELSTLRLVDLIHLEAAASMDALAAVLQRLTNNTYPWGESDSVKQLRRVCRILSLLKLHRRKGLQHDLALEYPNRRPLLLGRCPACPQIGYNMEADWDSVTTGNGYCPELEHCNVVRLTRDGNFKLVHGDNQMKDPDDLDLTQGMGMFPSVEKMEVLRQTALRGAPPKQWVADGERGAYPSEDDGEDSGKDDKVACNNFKAVTTATSKRHHAAAYTGIGQSQCGHVFILAAAPFKKGEDSATMDMALCMGMEVLSLPPHAKDDDPRPACHDSYDCNCSSSVHVDYRWSHDALCHMRTHIRNSKHLIPAAHVQGHKSNCHYLYGPFYQANAAHFHGETAEHPWARFNKFAPQIFRMNLNHAHEEYLLLCDDWNWLKFINLPNELYKSVRHAQNQYIRFKGELAGETAKHPTEAAEWDKMDRRPTVAKVNGKVVVNSPMKHRELNLPSFERAMALYMDNPRLGLGVKSTDTHAALISDGLYLERSQRNVKLMALKIKTSFSEQLQKSIDSQRALLEMHLPPFWRARKEILGRTIEEASDVTLTPLAHTVYNDEDIISDVITLGVAETRTSRSKPVEDWLLCLPSRLSAADQARFPDLCRIEANAREGLLYDGLRNVLDTANAIPVALAKLANAPTTRSKASVRRQVTTLHFKLDLEIAEVNAHRDALENLGSLEEKECIGLRALSVHDVFVGRSGYGPRLTGDSRIAEGRAFIWFREMSTSNMGRGFSERRGVKRLRGPEEGQELPNKLQKTIKNYPATSKTRSVEDKENVPPTQKGKRQERGKFAAAIADPEYDARQAESREVDCRSKGWLFDLLERGNKEANDIVAWRLEGDRVQWFRTDQEMKRWQEEHEEKQVDFLRFIRGIKKDRAAWTNRGDTIAAIDGLSMANKGRVAFARERQRIFDEMTERAERRMRAAGYGHIIDFSTIAEIQEHFLAVRAGKKGAHLAVEPTVQSMPVVKGGVLTEEA